MPAALPAPRLWEPGHADPWLLLTDLAPRRPMLAGIACAWIEQGFTLTKHGGFQWQRTSMTNPDRAARWWLAVALAARWRLRVDGEADAAITVGAFPDLLLPQRRQRAATQIRRVSVVRRGWHSIRASPPFGRVYPEPRPAFPSPIPADLPL